MTIFEALEEAIEARAHEAIIAGIGEMQPYGVVIERAGKAFSSSLAASGYVIVRVEATEWAQKLAEQLRKLEDNPDAAECRRTRELLGMYEMAMLAAAQKERG